MYGCDGSRKYVVPEFTSAASATTTGTEMNDIVTISQHSAGNTIVDVASGGKTAKMDLGKIASISVSSGGADKVNVAVRNYYGGITVFGGTGEDTVDIKAQASLRTEEMETTFWIIIRQLIRWFKFRHV